MEANKIIITGGSTRIGAAIAKKLSGPNVEIVIQYNNSKLIYGHPLISNIVDFDYLTSIIN